MKNKKLAVITLSAIMLVGSLFAVTAEGQSEKSSTNPSYNGSYTGRRGWNNSDRPRYRMNYTLNKENEISVTGTISLSEDMHPVLKTDEKEYELMVPRFLVYQAGLKDGAKVSVTGYKLENGDNSKEIELFVTKATINGKTYEIDKEIGKYMTGRRGMQSRRPGRGRRDGMPRGGRYPNRYPDNRPRS